MHMPYVSPHGAISSGCRILPASLSFDQNSCRTLSSECDPFRHTEKLLPLWSSSALGVSVARSTNPVGALSSAYMTFFRSAGSWLAPKSRKL